MIEPCASPAMYVWYAGNQQMNPGQSTRDTHHPVHLSGESTPRMFLYQVLLTRQCFFFQVKRNIQGSRMENLKNHEKSSMQGKILEFEKSWNFVK